MDLRRLLFPRSVAVIGGKPAAEVVRQNRRLGFSGDIWPVHPHLAEIEGHGVHRDVADLPHAPDAVFLAVNRHATLDIVARLAARGAGGVVCYASGFAETGTEGALLQRRLREAAGTMPVLGPNCYGTINYLDRVALWPDQHGGEPVASGVALVTQSGNIGLNLTMQGRALPIAYLATVGNQAVVGLSAIVAALAADRRITAIGLHVEAIDDPPAFAAAVSQASAAGIPVVVLKTGASATGATLTISHTASLGGADAVADAWLARIGAGRVRTLPELLETLKLLHVHGRFDGGEIVSMSCSGGEAALFADRAEGRRVRFRPFTPAQNEHVAGTVSSLVAVSNPFDYHTFDWADRARLGATFTAVMQAEFALTLLVLDFPSRAGCADDDWMVAASALHDAKRATGGRAAIVATLPEGMPEARARTLMNLGIAPLCGLDEALTAIEIASSVRSAGEAPISPALREGNMRTLDEWESKQLLARHGVPVPRGARFADWTEAQAPAFPAVVKALGIAHKTEHAALRLDLHDATSVTEAARALQPLGTRLLVEKMVRGVEIIVGVARDPAFGLYLLIGSGGTLAELVGDRRILMLPSSAADIREALATLRVARLLAGYRGQPPADTEAAVSAIVAIAAFALAQAECLVELDVNPLMVAADRAVAADALIRMTEPPCPTP